MKDKRTIVLAAYPRLTGRLRTIFSTAEGSIQKRLENPPIIREHGWSLETSDRAKIVRGEAIRAKDRDGNRDLKSIDLYQDGTLIFAGLADRHFIGWRSSSKDPRIHPIALVEVVYNFIDFYRLVLADFCRFCRKTERDLDQN